MTEKIDYLKKVEGFIDNALKTMLEVVLESNKLFYKIIEFPLRIVIVLGIFAGFGFTGISYVENIWLFIAGEFCFAIAVITGLYWYKKIILNHKTIYKGYVDKLNKYIEKWESIGLDIAKEGVDDRKFKENVLRMQKESSEIFQKRPQVSDFILNMILWIFGIAVILLLFSFLPVNWSRVFSYLLSAIYFCQS